MLSVASPVMRRDLLVAVTASSAVVLGAPYVGQIRGRLQEALPAQYRTIVAALVIAAAGAAVVAAVARIRERRFRRYLCLATALAIAIAYGRATRTGNVDQDLVEQFHFVEYGVVTYLFYRVWRDRGDGAALMLPLCAGVIVGILDEWFQWFIPGRVGELRDVLINAVAVACGLLFSVGVHPVRVDTTSTAGRRAIAASAAAVILAAAVFVDAVHLGHEVYDPRVGTFRSQFAGEALIAASTERAGRWRAQPPVTSTGIAREDHYLSEGQWHVQRRNEAAGDPDRWRAWHENLILETFFAPVLDLGSRWTAEQRADAEVTALSDRASYLSDAEPYPIVAISRTTYWASVAAILTALAVIASVRTQSDRRRVAR
jgi:VanZ family protein